MTRRTDTPTSHDALPRSQTERSRGFGFVTMVDIEAAKAVIEALNGIVSADGLIRPLRTSN